MGIFSNVSAFHQRFAILTMTIQAVVTRVRVGVCFAATSLDDDVLTWLLVGPYLNFNWVHNDNPAPFVDGLMCGNASFCRHNMDCH